MSEGIFILKVFTGLAVIGMPWIIQYWIEPLMYRRSVQRERIALAKAGLTQEQYMATIDPNNSMLVAAAKNRLGID